jgi:hypothetical protein
MKDIFLWLAHTFLGVLCYVAMTLLTTLAGIGITGLPKGIFLLAGLYLLPFAIPVGIALKGRAPPAILKGFIGAAVVALIASTALAALIVLGLLAA